MTVTRISPKKAVPSAVPAAAPQPPPAPASHALALNQHQPRRFVDRTENERILGQGQIDMIQHNELLPEGYSPLIKIPNAQSVWDEACWPQSGYPRTARKSKAKSKKKFLVNDRDMDDLCWIEGPVYKLYPSHEYLVREVERRAWEKYGGPQGLDTARKLHSNNELKAQEKQARKQHKPDDRNNAGLPTAVGNSSGHQIRKNNSSKDLKLPGTPTYHTAILSTPKRQDSKRKHSPEESSEVEEDEHRHDFPPSSPFSMSSSPVSYCTTTPTRGSFMTKSTPTQRMPSAGPSTPIRTPKSPVYRKGPYSTPTRAHYSKSQSQSGESSKRVAVDIDLTLDSEEDGGPVSSSSRRLAKISSAKTKAPVLWIDPNIIEISD